MQNELILEPLKFKKRLVQAFQAPFHVWILFEHYNLKEMLIRNNIKDMHVQYEEDFPEILQKLREKDENFSERMLELEKNVQTEIEEYLPILLNQSLVMIITVFDVFLNSSLQTIIRKQPNLLKQLADSEKSITVSEIIDSKNYEEIFDRILNRVLKNFDFKSIEQKISLLKKIGVETEKALSFKFHKQKTQSKFPEGRKLLISYYSQRHDIVHQDKHYLKTTDELEKITEFFSFIIMSFAVAMGKHFDIKSDFDLQIKPFIKEVKKNEN